MTEIFIHPTANVDKRCKIGLGTKIWINAQIRENAVIGNNCIISKDTYIDHGVNIGSNTKIQNGVSIYNGVTIEDDVFIGPNATFTNDKIPRAFSPSWKIIPTIIKRGASIGANATIICGVTIGEYSMVAAGSVVTKDVEPYSLVMGNPAIHKEFIDKMGNKQK
jgi:acetyltransferase-like isoleucine patch superfamily enzyme